MATQEEHSSRFHKILPSKTKPKKRHRAKMMGDDHQRAQQQVANTPIHHTTDE